METKAEIKTEPVKNEKNMPKTTKNNIKHEPAVVKKVN